jgi:hypothetical protein
MGCTLQSTDVEKKITTGNTENTGKNNSVFLSVLPVFSVVDFLRSQPQPSKVRSFSRQTRVIAAPLREPE